jgi:dethiobiotin synthetase
MKYKKYFVTAIGTDIGKTMVSAVLCNALKADYWKPIQCGSLDFTDSDFVRKYSDQKVFDEKYKLSLPASPHWAALSEGKFIDLNSINIPDTTNHLIIEGAGGMMVPINEKNDLVIDIAKNNDLPIIIVSSFYLGSINHTLLTLEFAKFHNLKIAMLIFSGDVNESSLSAIKSFFPELKIGFIPKLDSISKDTVMLASENFKLNYLNELV